MKSSFAIYQALRSINVPEDKATAVVDALESDVQTQLATKADLAKLKRALTIRMGFMLLLAIGIMLTAFKYMH